jgi:hypothetical protein
MIAPGYWRGVLARPLEVRRLIAAPSARRLRLLFGLRRGQSRRMKIRVVSDSHDRSDTLARAVAL